MDDLSIVHWKNLVDMVDFVHLKDLVDMEVKDS